MGAEGGSARVHVAQTPRNYKLRAVITCSRRDPPGFWPGDGGLEQPLAEMLLVRTKVDGPGIASAQTGGH